MAVAPVASVVEAESAVGDQTVHALAAAAVAVPHRQGAVLEQLIQVTKEHQ